MMSQLSAIVPKHIYIFIFIKILIDSKYDIILMPWQFSLQQQCRCQLGSSSDRLSEIISVTVKLQGHPTILNEIPEM
jgi:hypothetical protein